MRYHYGDKKWNKEQTAAVQKIAIPGYATNELIPGARVKSYVIWKVWFYRGGELIAERALSYKHALQLRARYGRLI
jgi:hypothetical protein